MPGISYRIIPKQAFFAVPTQAIQIAKAIDLSQYREATFLLRVHAGTTLTGAGTLLIVQAMIDAPTREDGANFIGPNIGTPITITSATLPPFVQFSTMASTNLPSYCRVQLTWAGTVTGQAILSADLIAKS